MQLRNITVEIWRLLLLQQKCSSSKNAPPAIETSMDKLKAANAVVEELALRKGTYYGAAICCFSDPGLSAKETFDVPIVGMCESAVYFSSFYSKQFSILSFCGPGDVSYFLKHMKTYGAEIRLSSVEYLGTGVLEVSDNITDDICQKIELCINRDGVGAILLGCAAFAGLGSKLTEKYGIVITDGVDTSIMTIKMLAEYSNLYRKEVNMMSNIGDAGRWINKRLDELAENTMIDGQIWRASYTEQDRTAKKLLRKWIEDSGLIYHEDVMGNVFGRLQGKKEETILVGSHIDTVKDGGKYDGAAGVITGIAALRSLKETGFQPEYSIEVVGLIEEEGSRFAASCHGSCSIVGTLKKEDLDELDQNGIAFRDAMIEAGYDPKKFYTAKRNDIKAYIELHVEQGPVLEKSNKQIGIVDNIVGIVTYDIVIEGEQNHAGTTFMSMRLDPVVAASNFISEATAEIMKLSPSATLTFGRVDTYPGMQNVIAKRVHLLLDMRDKDEASLKREEKFILDKLNALSDKGFKVEPVRTQWTKPVAMNNDLIEILQRAVDEGQFSSMHINSGAGHDAMVFAKAIPTAMIFIPSCRGISHNPLEFTKEEDLKAGFMVLRQMLSIMAK